MRDLPISGSSQFAGWDSIACISACLLGVDVFNSLVDLGLLVISGYFCLAQSLSH
jgi:uncharacterized membrane protein YhhN